ncbi:hypothetical protein IFM89_021970 [Coptis chinensis]|uniref:J domain-containing protein n=1 Tax=Coptis chinensis TaxID=261450 RepID=A0A835LWN3_9MAGN|nr:hypothetical protein IFM89_021970 [Coptis chinensis]
MDISCHLKTKEILLVARTSSQKSHKINNIKCSVNILATQRRKSSNLYEVLSLESNNVGSDDIKKAYRSMALQYHPDVVPLSRKEESTRKFVEFQKAYETLSNPISRQKYDYQLRLGDVSEGGVHEMQNESYKHFPSEVWENQLEGLQQRSQSRIKRNKRTYI